MAISTPAQTHEGNVALLCQAAEEIKLRADDMIGDVDGVGGITVKINMNPAEAVTIETTKSYFSGYRTGMEVEINA